MSFIETIPFIRLVKEEINLFRFRKKGREDERIPSVQLDFKLQRRKKQFMKPIPSPLPPSFCASSPSLPVVNFIPFLLLTNETASLPPSPLPVLSSSSISLFFFCPRLFPPSSSLPVSPPWSCSWIPSNHFPPDRRAAERGILFFLAKKRDISENPRAWLGERLEGARRVSFGLHSIYPCSFGSKIEKPEKDQTLHRFPPFALVERESPDGLLLPPLFRRTSPSVGIGEATRRYFLEYLEVWTGVQFYLWRCNLLALPCHHPPSLSSWKNLSKGAANNFLKKRLPNQGRKREGGAFPRPPRLSSSPTPLILPHKEKVPLTDPLVSPLPPLPPRRPN